jgi:hypothetical protein
VKLGWPPYRRWTRFLEGLSLDPDSLTKPIAEPDSHDFIICGSPRSGTSLLSAALYQPPRIAVVMDPWDGVQMPPAALFASLRDEIDSTGGLVRGRLDIEALESHGHVRWSREMSRRVAVQTDRTYLLGVKWPVFWRYLDLLPNTRFLVCLRHPYEVISSYRRSGGRLALGLEYDIAFNRKMNQELEASTGDMALRRVHLFDYIHERVIPHLLRSNVLVIRYERWFTESHRVIQELQAFLGVDLDPSRVVIRRPRVPPQPESERALIRAHCSTAEALGYEL